MIEPCSVTVSPTDKSMLVCSIEADNEEEIEEIREIDVQHHENDKSSTDSSAMSSPVEPKFERKEITPVSSPPKHSISPIHEHTSEHESIVVERLKMGKWGQNLCFDDRDINLSFSFGSLNLDPVDDLPDASHLTPPHESIPPAESASINNGWDTTTTTGNLNTSTWEKEVTEAGISTAYTFPSPVIEPAVQMPSVMMKNTPPGFGVVSAPVTQGSGMSPMVGSSLAGPPPGLPLLSKMQVNEVEIEAEVMSKAAAAAAAQHQAALQLQIQKQEQFQAQQQAMAIAQQAQIQQQVASMQMHQQVTNAVPQNVQSQTSASKQEVGAKPKKDPVMSGFHGSHKQHTGNYSPAHMSQHPQGAISYGQSSTHSSMGVIPQTGYVPPPGMTGLPQGYGAYSQNYGMYGGYQSAPYYYPPQQQHYQGGNGFSQQGGSRAVYHQNMQPRGPYPNEFGQNGGVMGYNVDHQYPPSHYSAGQEFGMNGGGLPPSQQVGSVGAPGLGNEKSQQVLGHPGIGGGMYHSHGTHYGQPAGGHSMGGNDSVPGWSPQAVYNTVGAGGHHAPSSQPQGGGVWSGNMGPQNSVSGSHGQYHPHHQLHTVSSMGQHPYNGQYPGSGGGDTWTRS
jgi:DNA-binding protein H-NS